MQLQKTVIELQFFVIAGMKMSDTLLTENFIFASLTCLLSEN